MSVETRSSRVVVRAVGVALLVLALGARAAHAVPSFARQTGMPCDGCHSAGFYPELNEFGRLFKLNGYIWSSHTDQSYEPIPPFSAAQEFSLSHTDKKQPSSGNLPTVHFSSPGNDVVSYPQQANFFLAGRFYGRLGGFVMGTYSGADNKWVADNIDVRLTQQFTLSGHSLLVGGTFNNGPTVQDAWNTLPAWNQLIGSEVAPGPAASPMVANLISQVAGIGVYGLWDNYLYAEVTPYLPGRSGPYSFITAGNPKDVNTDGVSPYWRLVLTKSDGPHSLSVGQFGLYDKVFQSGGSHGATNTYLDLGGDVQYQWNSRPHFVTLRGAFIWENQGLAAAKAAGAAVRDAGDLHTLQLWGSYSYYDLIGMTVSFFDIGGSRDRLMYPAGALDGSRNGRPDSLGGFVQLNLLPFSRWFHQMWPALPMTQFALQYTVYGKFNGGSSNYDGSGRTASDNNTLYLLAWTPW